MDEQWSTKAADSQVGGPILTGRFKLWTLALVSLLATQAAASAFLPRSFALTLVSNFVAFGLLLSACLIFLLDRARGSERDRLFWTLLAVHWGIQVIAQLIWMHFELVLRRNVPNPFAGDLLPFLSHIPVLAALLLQPHLEPIERRKSLGAVEFLLLLLWFLYLYVFFVMPWQYSVVNEALYDRNYDRLDGLLHVAQAAVLAFLWKRSSGAWRRFYGVFFVAQCLMGYFTYLVNHAIDTGEYYSGSWFDLPFALGLASFTLVGIMGTQVAGSIGSAGQKKAPLQGEWFGILVVLSLPIMAGWAVLDRHALSPVVQFRELATLGTILAMSVLVFIKLHGLGAELTAANETLREASLTDPLTGLRNRRFFDAMITADAEQVLRSYGPHHNGPRHDLIFYIVDLDEFKMVNDSYGHDVGDRVLIEVARRITSAVRTSDVVLRWGGDEFMVISRYAARQEAGLVPSRILEYVGLSEIGLPCIDTPVRQTCSIGWAVFPWLPERPHAVSVEAVLGLADNALYEAKTAGKNRAVGVGPLDAGDAGGQSTLGGDIFAYKKQAESIAGPAKSWRFPSSITSI